jgi:hypothetical protein
VAGAEGVELGIREVPQAGTGAWLGEEGIAQAPDDEGGRLVVAEQMLPDRGECDVGVVVQSQGDLGFLRPGWSRKCWSRPACRGTRAPVRVWLAAERDRLDIAEGEIGLDGMRALRARMPSCAPAGPLAG